jgi:tRNA A22 N-methylase
MSVTSLETYIENGQIKLVQERILPEKMKVYVIVSTTNWEPVFRVSSPRLKHSEQAAHFIKEMSEGIG